DAGLVSHRGQGVDQHAHGTCLPHAARRAAGPATRRYASQDEAAQRSQVNDRAASSPPSASDRIQSSSVAALSMAVRQASASSGSIRQARGPAVSATAPALEATTAPPVAIISMVGMPKPS